MPRAATTPAVTGRAGARPLRVVVTPRFQHPPRRRRSPVRSVVLGCPGGPPAPAPPDPRSGAPPWAAPVAPAPPSPRLTGTAEVSVRPARPEDAAAVAGIQ